MSDVCQVDAGEKLHISVVESLHEQLEDALSNHLSVELDVSKVGQVDTASMQLLYAYQLAAENAGVSITFMHPTDSVIAGAKLLGLQNYFKMS
jgi:ABC-type transporter Mla MlaB component